MSEPADGSKDFFIPHLIRPDHMPNAAPSFGTDSEVLPVMTPHITGRVAFVIGPRTISYAESIMSVVEEHHLGKIVGSATAGSDGNVSEVTAPTGCRMWFTGMVLKKPDGSQFHLVGIRPTINPVRALAGVSSGRDDVLERALAYVRTGAT